MTTFARALVTGSDGFIGSHLAETLVRSGLSVRALCQYNSFGSWGWLDDSPLKKDMDVVLGDVRDPEQMRTACQGIDVVFHLAALIAIPYSYQAPASYVDTNVHGTLNLLNAARAAGCSRFVQTSTSEVYGSARFVPISEAHPLHAQSPYSASKIGADALAYSYYCSFGMPVTIARPFNTFGPRQSARAVIPTVIVQLLSGASSIKLGALTPTRDFNYVQDTCDAFVALAEADAAIGQTVNMGSGREISIKDTVELIASIAGRNAEILCDEERLRPIGSEVDRLCCDNSLMQTLTGFRPRVSLESGLKNTIDWLSKPDNLKRYKADIFNV